MSEKTTNRDRKLVLEGRLEMSPNRAVIITKDKMRQPGGPNYPQDYTPLFDAVVGHFFFGEPSHSVTMCDVRITIESFTDKPIRETPYQDRLSALAKILREEGEEALNKHLCEQLGEDQ